MQRRKFLTTSFALGGLSIINIPAFALHELTIQQVIDRIISKIPGTPFNDTVDTVKSGNANQKVTGIVTTMFATVNVIRKAIELKANFIIAHEPTFYSHTDSTGWLEDDAVFKYKRELLEKNNIVVWRFHDYIHTINPDGVLMGVLESLGWAKLYNTANPNLIEVPLTTVGDVIKRAKEKLGIGTLRFVGDASQPVRRIGILPGAYGGTRQINFIKANKPDLFICGELAEWETSEYIRDARAAGAKMSLIVLGHVQSEEPGMKWLAKWLQPEVPGVTVTHVPATSPFTYD